jgi:hypothetical protein
MTRDGAGANLITSGDLERAERLLSQTYQVAVGTDAHNRLAYRAKIDPMAMGNFIAHHKENLFRHYLPEIDPRHEPAIVTMLVHMLCTGAVAQRVSEGKS